MFLHRCVIWKLCSCVYNCILVVVACLGSYIRDTHTAQGSPVFHVYSLQFQFFLCFGCQLMKIGLHICVLPCFCISVYASLCFCVYKCVLCLQVCVSVYCKSAFLCLLVCVSVLASMCFCVCLCFCVCKCVLFVSAWTPSVFPIVFASLFPIVFPFVFASLFPIVFASLFYFALLIHQQRPHRTQPLEGWLGHWPVRICKSV